ncbi:AraC family transcriptional regulator [Paenibacillus marchantiophytorum]|uniref:AraC family transcriptional regulator n=1 Tax=Paenibacillus marchantiophytorum TaxID=1619310 RepID=A0ABQ1EYN6_9BACL|nr:response regulator [Paenibacillus marchantiophytorum]GFZ92010.1 AraC family transcriptional regulator [Paenibacillus marchantiophytorum]
MRKVVIVDDEKWIRRGLIRSIPWDQFDLKLVGEAGDGEEAYAIALAEKPDLLFLDMRMPGLDGKQLIGMLNRDVPDVLTVVVSGYSDFEYTKEAIRHKAFEYLLKPVKKEELVAVLEKALAELQRRDDEKRSVQVESREDWFRRIVYQADASLEAREDAAEVALPEGWFFGETYVVVGQPDAFRDGSESINKVIPLLREHVHRSQPFLCKGTCQFVVTAAPDARQELVMAIVGEQLNQEDFSKFLHSVRSVLEQSGIGSYSFGISSQQPDAHSLRHSYAEAGQALKRKKLHTTGKVIFADNDKNVQLAAYPQEKENAFLLALQMGSRDGVQQEFDKLFAAISGDDVTVDYLQRGAMLLVHSIEKQLRGTETRLEEACGVTSLVYTERIKRRNDAASVKYIFAEEIIPSVLAYYLRSNEKQGEKIVRGIQKLIETHYDQPLSLHQIADSHYMNTDYVSRLFKKTTGQNFVDYLTDFRIHKSKELLKLSSYKNYEVAQMVGYEDYRYFSQIFKKKTGMTIGEYREKSL